MNASLMRLRGLMRKEIKQILRDPSAILIAFLMPIVLIVVNGYGISLDASEMKLAVVIEAPEENVLGLLQAIDSSPYLSAQRALSAHDAEAALTEGLVRGVLRFRDDFTQDLGRTTSWPARAQLVVNATDPNTARILEGYVAGALEVWLAGQAKEKRAAPAGDVDLEYRDWFNPELRSADFIVPGIIAMVMTMTGTLLTALIVAREWERGTMESMLASPARMGELIAAKLGCYFVLGMGSMAGSVVLSMLLFKLPYRASFAVLFVTAALFLIFALGLGLFISTLTRNQFVASQLAFLTTMMPAMMLSGMLFDITAMPRWLQIVTYVVPARYLVSILQTLFLAGDVWAVLLPNLAGLGIAAAVAVGTTVMVTRRRLD